MNLIDLRYIDNLKDLDLDTVDISKPAPEFEPNRQFYFMAKARSWVKKKSEELGRPMTFFTQTFGCQMNARDSEKLLGILTDIGYVETEDEHADFVIYNTCTVRENANNKVYGRLGYLSNFKKKNPHMMIALCGCMMQEPTVVEKIRKSYRFVDLVFGTHNIYKFAELLCNRMESDSMIIDIWKDTDKSWKIFQSGGSFLLNPVSISCSDVIISAVTVSFLMSGAASAAGNQKISSVRLKDWWQMVCVKSCCLDRMLILTGKI